MPFPTSVQNLIQKNLLSRVFHDALYPQLHYRKEASWSKWDMHTGNTRVQTRKALLEPADEPLDTSQDLPVDTEKDEQWLETLLPYGRSVDVNMSASGQALDNLFIKAVKKSGLQAGQSVNRVARNELFRCYNSGNTVAIAAIGATDTSIRVASINGFTQQLGSLSLLPQNVSASNPLTVTIGVGGAQVQADVVGVFPDNPSASANLGPGTLQLSAQVGAAFVIRSPIIASNAPKIIRPTVGDSVDAISASDTFVLQQVIQAVAQLRQDGVPVHDDGYYHCHISPIAVAQLFADGVFQRLNQSLPEHIIYKKGVVQIMHDCIFYSNNEAPTTTNSGTLISTSGDAFFSNKIGGEMVNDAGVKIGRTIVCGKDALNESSRINEGYVSEAGLNGKVGEFKVEANGAEVMTEYIRLILRAPIDRAQEKPSVSWKIETAFSCPSDATATSGPEKYKRARVLEHAL